MRPSIAPLLWLPRSNVVVSTDDPRDGWQDLGLGDPSTLWYARDQSPTLASFFTRYGFPWSKNEQDGGTLVKSSATWGVNSLPTVDWVGYGANVRLGLRCDQMGGTGQIYSLPMRTTFAFPIFFPAAWPSLVYDWCFQGGATDNNLFRNFYNTSSTPGLSCQANGTNVASVAAWTPANGFNVSTVRRGIVAFTIRQLTGTSVTFQYRLKCSLGTYSPNTRSASSAAVGNWDRFAIGYVPQLSATGAASGNVSYGGFVGWKSGASSAQLDAIIAKWETLYPLS